MRGVFSRSRRAAAACLLVVVLLAPAAFASGTASEESLWAEFAAWVQSRFDIPGGAAADQEGFTAWLMSRFNIPGG